MERNKKIFYDIIARQSRHWELLDKGVVKEDEVAKPYRPKNNNNKDNKQTKVKGKDFI